MGVTTLKVVVYSEVKQEESLQLTKRAKRRTFPPCFEEDDHTELLGVMWFVRAEKASPFGRVEFLLSKLRPVSYIFLTSMTKVYPLTSVSLRRGMSAVCVYTIQDIDHIFTTSPFKGEDGQSNRPREVQYVSTQLRRRRCYQFRVTYMTFL